MRWVVIAAGRYALIGTTRLEHLVSVWRRAPRCLVAARYRDTLGAPAIFPRWSFPELLRLHGDAGAKQLLLHFDAYVLALDVPEAAMDIDTPADLRALSLRARDD